MITLCEMFLQHIEELSNYFQFGLWWVALGVASSIGLGKYIVKVYYILRALCWENNVIYLKNLVLECLGRFHTAKVVFYKQVPLLCLISNTK